MIYEDVEITSGNDIVNTFAKYFSSVYDDGQVKIEEFDDYYKSNPIMSAEYIPALQKITVEDVEEGIVLLKVVLQDLTRYPDIQGEFFPMFSMGIFETSRDRESLKWGKNCSFASSI